MTSVLVLAVSIAIDVSSLAGASRADEAARLDVAALHGQLLVRLAEEGLAVRAPTSPTGYTVRLAPADGATDGAIALEVIGRERRGERVAPGEPALVALEVSQRAIAALREVAPRPVAAIPMPRLVVHFAAPGDVAAANRLHQELAIAAVTAGFELVAASTAGARQVCATIAHDRVELALPSVDGGCGAAREVDAIARTAAPDAVVRKVVARATALVAPIRAIAATRAVAAAVVARPVDGRSRGATHVFGLGVASGVSARGGTPADDTTGLASPPTAFDAQLAIAADAGRRDGFGAAARVVLAPSSGGNLDVLETHATVGPRWRREGRRWALTAGLRAGLLVHRYRRSGESVSAVLDWIALGGVDLSRRLADRWWLTLASSVGRAGHTRVHTAGDGAVLWRRDGRQLAIELGVSRTF